MKKIKLQSLIMARNFIPDDTNFYGLCGVGYDLDRAGVFSIPHLQAYYAYLKEWQPHFLKQDQYGYWWEAGDKAPRLKWLDKHIKKLQDELRIEQESK
jgi:hypothetical protein